MDSAQYWFNNPIGTITAKTIDYSLRFRGSQNLSRTQTSAGSGRDFTLSFWVRKAMPRQNNTLFWITTSGGRTTEMWFDSSGDGGALVCKTTNGANAFDQTRRYRDINGWYHFVVSHVAGSSVKSYVNGVLDSSISDSNDWHFNDAGTIYIGQTASSTNYHQGHLAEIHFVDGQALDQHSFGGTDSQGVWVPKTVDISDYGVNGYYLSFSNAGSIGADSAAIASSHSSANNFSSSGFDLSSTTGTGSWAYDHSIDTPTKLGMWSQDEEETQIANSRSNHYRGAPTIRIHPPPSGYGYYYEGTPNGSSSRYYGIGYVNDRGRQGTHFYWHDVGCDGGGSGRYWDGVGTVSPSLSVGSAGAGGYSSSVTGHLIDGTNRRITIWDGSSQSYQNTYSAEEWEEILYWYIGGTGGQCGRYVNMRLGTNQATFDYASRYSGLTLCNSTINLPATSITDPSEHFDVIADTGDIILSRCQAKYPNGLYIIKSRDNSEDWRWVNTISGTSNTHFSPARTVGAYSNPSGNAIAYCFKTDSNGLNTTAGFEIVEYTGNGSTQNISHNLGKKPHFIVITKKTTGSELVAFHRGLDSMTNHYINMDAQGNSTNVSAIGNTGPTTTTFGVGNSNLINENGVEYVAYVWTSIRNFSFFGWTTGSNNTNGYDPFCRFQSHAMWMKGYQNAASTSWNQVDTVLNPTNPATSILKFDQTSGETTVSGGWDICSQTFRARHAGGDINSSSLYWIFCSWAERPHATNGITPTPAR